MIIRIDTINVNANLTRSNLIMSIYDNEYSSSVTTRRYDHTSPGLMSSPYTVVITIINSDKVDTYLRKIWFIMQSMLLSMVNLL